MVNSFWIVRKQHILSDLVERVLAKLCVDQVHLVLELGSALKVETEDLVLEELDNLSILFDVPLFLKLFLGVRDQVSHSHEGNHIFKINE